MLSHASVNARALDTIGLKASLQISESAAKKRKYHNFLSRIALQSAAYGLGERRILCVAGLKIIFVYEVFDGYVDITVSRRIRVHPEIVPKQFLKVLRLFPSAKRCRNGAC